MVLESKTVDGSLVRGEMGIGHMSKKSKKSD